VHYATRMKPTRRALVRWMTVALVFGSPLPVFAFPSSRLVYARASGAESCPAEPEVRKEVATRLGYDPFFPWAQRTIVVQVARGSKGLRATVQLVDADGMVKGGRELASTADDCDELMRSVALNVSIAIDPDSADRKVDAVPTPPEGEPEPAGGRRDERPRPLAAPPAAVADPAEAPSQPPAVVPFVGAGVHLATGLTPVASAGPSLTAGFSWGWGSLAGEIGGDWGVGLEHEVRANQVSFSLVPCVAGRLVVGCVVGSIGELYAEAVRSDHAMQASVGLRLGAAVALARGLTFTPYVGAALPLERTIVTIGGARAWQVAKVAGAAGLQLAVAFP
jgi:hypothetical protein